MEDNKLEIENENLRTLIEHSWEMVKAQRVYINNPLLFTTEQKAELDNLFALYRTMLEQVGFSEASDLLVPEETSEIVKP